MRGAHAARAVLLLASCCFCQWAAAGGEAQGRHALAAHGLALVERATAKMPGGMANLCERDPDFCAAAGPPDPVLMLSAEIWAVLQRTNQRVNHRIASTTDRELYGRDEYWTIPSTAGDCEDYVLLKRQMLMREGMAASSLLITVVHDENGEGHAVLTVPTRAGDLVLDNRRDEILYWWHTGYSFIKRQSESDPRQWVTLGPDRLQATDIASGPGLP